MIWNERERERERGIRRVRVPSIFLYFGESIFDFVNGVNELNLERGRGRGLGLDVDVDLDWKSNFVEAVDVAIACAKNFIVNIT